MTAVQKKVWVEGGEATTLAPSNHVATGGEGALYVKGQHAYKLWLDPARALTQDLPAKMSALSQIRHPALVTPEALLNDAQGNVVGYRMRAVSANPLVKCFSNTWRDENGFGGPESALLVSAMREALLAAHDAGALVVDGNETNWMFEGARPFLIDTDSWQFRHWPATALMPSIRDWHQARPCAGSDWFAWAIVTFQVFTGIHPYKGSHPAFRRGDLEGRMRANVSVFDPAVRTSGAVRPLSAIPQRLRSWYENVFMNGDRSAPPLRFEGQTPTVTAPRYSQRQPASGGVLERERLCILPGKLRKVFSNAFALLEEDGGFQCLDLLTPGKPAIPLPAWLGQSVAENRAVPVRRAGSWSWLALESNAVMLHGPHGARLSHKALPLNAQRLGLFGNAAFAVLADADNGLQSLEIMGDAHPEVFPGQSWPVLVRSSVFAGNFLVMNGLGMPFLVIPGKGSAMPVAAPGLKTWKIINGWAAGESLAVVSAMERQTGRYARLWLRKNGAAFEVFREDPTDVPDLSAAATDNGILVVADTQGLILAASGKTREVPLDFGENVPRLLGWGNTIAVEEQHALSRLTLKG